MTKFLASLALLVFLLIGTGCESNPADSALKEEPTGEEKGTVDEAAAFFASAAPSSSRP